MKQYLELAKAVKEKGTYKAPAREGMPGTTSLFGYQFRHDLSEGFPLLTTKKLSFKNIVVELLWFLRGDTNIKYLVDNGCNIWNEDAYNYYKKLGGNRYSFENFVEVIKFNSLNGLYERGHDEIFKVDYTLGDCGVQYGKLWRNWSFMKESDLGVKLPNDEWIYSKGLIPGKIDQIKELIDGLKNSPMSRRHLLSAWNPTTLNDMALNACHVLVQFNCRPLKTEEKIKWVLDGKTKTPIELENLAITEAAHDPSETPQYYLDCQMYQRSADLFLGVPYNIASYALLTHILCKICNMIPGDFIHTFGDVHIYDNHMEQIDEQLSREPRELPELVCLERNEKGFIPDNLDKYFSGRYDLDDFISSLKVNEFRVKNYDPHPAIKGKLSTGLK